MSTETIAVPTDVRVYTRDEQKESLKSISESAAFLGERPLARLVWQYANGVVLTDHYMDWAFQRNSAALRGVPLATIYNRIRRIRGKIK